MAALAKFHLKKFSVKSLTAGKSSDFNVGDGWVEGWISPETIDTAGDVIPVDAWDLTRHKINPVALVHHNKMGPVPGRFQHPDGTYSVEKRAGGLWGRCYFNLDHPAGREEYDLYRKGFKRGFSPGFMAPGNVGYSTFKGRRAKVIPHAILAEVSLVNLPENPLALATYCKSLSAPSGNNSEAIPDGYVFRYGVQIMPEAKKGIAGYFDSLMPMIEVVKSAKTKLLTELPEGEERNKAYGLLAPFYAGLKAIFTEAGPSIAKDEPWAERTKQLGEVFEGFEEFTKQLGGDSGKATVAEIEAMLGDKVGKLIDEKLAEPITRINEIQDVVKVHDEQIKTHDTLTKSHDDLLKNHETALEGVIGAVETLAG